jgi:hypothetical protein
LREPLEGRDLIAGQPDEDQFADRSGVGRGGSPDGLPPLRGQDGEGTPPVVVALLAGHQPPSLHAGQVMRQPALLPTEEAGQLGHSAPATGYFAERHQHVVIGQR